MATSITSGILHHGNPYVITKFPEPHSVKIYKEYQPDPQKLIDERVLDDYIALTQLPDILITRLSKMNLLRNDFILKIT